MKAKQKAYWWIDVALFLGFLVAFFLSFTGVELHQWIGILGGLLAGYHLLAHREWVGAVSRRLFRSASGIVKLKYLMDGVLLAGFASILVTGLVISTWLDLTLKNYTNWLSLHIIVSVATLLVLIMKLAIHWRWISRKAKETLSPATMAAGNTSKLQPVVAERTVMDRRDFLKVMGVIGGASLVAIMSATQRLAALQDNSSNITSQTAGSDAGSSDGVTGNSFKPYSPNYSTGGSCSIQCGRRCSYPGGCRRYCDADNDSLCDYGECS
jgi:hypothetical protein